MDKARSSKLTRSSNVASERAWKVAQLAAVLVQTSKPGERAPAGLEVNPRLTSKELDPYFAAALKRADLLLSWAEGHEGCVHAYQLFQEGDRLTEEQVKEVFREANWNRLMSKDPVMNFMKALRDRFDEQLESLRIDCSQADEDVRVLQEEVDEAISTAFANYSGGSVETMPSDIRSCRDEVMSCVREKISEGLAHQFSRDRLMSLAREEAFMAWCFPGPTAEEQATRVYRPHEIFKRCAVRRWETARLVRPRSTIAQIPYPPEDVRREIYPMFEAAHPDLG